MSKKKRVLVNTQLVVAVARHDSRNNNNNNNARPTSHSCLRTRGTEWRRPLCEALLNEYVGTLSRLAAAKDAAMQGGVA